MKRDTFRTAFCGLITAFAFVLMLLTNLVPVGTYAFPCLAGMVLVTVVIEFGWKWALGSYAAISLLSIFLAGDKEAVVYFVAFFGFYPIIKSLIERLPSRVIQYIIKYSVFTVCMIGAFLVCKFVLMLPNDDFTIAGMYIPWVFLIAGEIIFIVYDLAVTVIVTNYINRIRGKLFKDSFK